MNLPTQVNDITERSRGWWDEAAPIQRYVAIGAAALMVLVIGFVTSSGFGDGGEEWDGRILYANLEFDEAAVISNRLRIMEVPHRLTPDATTILVPEDQYMDLRITLAGEGFPKSGRIGYEIFDEVDSGVGGATGTSAACPTVAALIALASKSAGMRTLVTADL